MHHLGQHFLKNPGVAKKIIAALDLRPGDTVIEIGPGHGELTSFLASETNRRIVAIEKDHELARELTERFRGNKTVCIVEGDVRTELVPLVTDMGQTSYKIVGNIPYYLTGELLRILGNIEKPPLRIVLMVQKEVALRIVTHPPKMNRLAAIVQYWAEPKIVGFVSKDEFNPPPEVDSAIIALTPQTINPKGKDLYFKTVKTLFAQPRKTVLNNLLAGSADLRTKNKKKVAAALAELGIDTGIRPQNLSVETISKFALKIF